MQHMVFIGVLFTLIALTACDNNGEQFDAPTSVSIAEVWAEGSSFEGKLVKVVGEFQRGREPSYVLRSIEAAAQNGQELSIRFESELVPEKLSLCENEQVVVIGTIPRDESRVIVAEYVTLVSNYEQWNFDSCHDDGIVRESK